MKIYEAKLILRALDEEYVSRFDFKELKLDYSYNNETKEYIENGVGWVRDRVSSIPEYTTYYGIHKIKQGFDRQLSESELKELEITFKKNDER